MLNNRVTTHSRTIIETMKLIKKNEINQVYFYLLIII